MARNKILLDCTKLTINSRRGKRMFARLRYYYGSRSANFNRKSSDLEVHAYAYAQYYGSGIDESISRDRVNRDHQAWLNGEIAPDYLCSELRRALKDRDHRLISIKHLEQCVVPLVA